MKQPPSLCLPSGCAAITFGPRRGHCVTGTFCSVTSGGEQSASACHTVRSMDDSEETDEKETADESRRRPQNIEPRRLLGWQPIVDDYEPRVLGLPKRWFGSLSTVDTRWLRHPIQWTHWCILVHRRGPYAPDYDEFLTRRTGRDKQRPQER